MNFQQNDKTHHGAGESVSDPGETDHGCCPDEMSGKEPETEIVGPLNEIGDASRKTDWNFQA